jgi:hypothetical protein
MSGKPVRAGFAGRRQFAGDRVEVLNFPSVIVGIKTTWDESERRDGRVCNHVTSSFARPGMFNFISVLWRAIRLAKGNYGEEFVRWKSSIQHDGR